MAKVEHIIADDTELILMVRGKNKYETMHLTYDQIKRIRISNCNEFSLLKMRSVPSEKIEILASNAEQPIVFTKMKEQPFFDAYKQKLAEFAKRNRVSFVDETKDS